MSRNNNWKFYIPKNETIPTKLEVRSDSYAVQYWRLNDCFGYGFSVMKLTTDAWITEEDERAVVEEIVSIMRNQSYDHGAEWRVVSTERVDEGRYLPWWCVKLRVRDAG